MMRRARLLVLTVVMIVGVGVALPRHSTAAGPGPCVHGPTQQMYNSAARWTTPNTPSCTPFFAAGAPLPNDYPLTETVIRLTPISSVPKEPPPSRPITSEPVRPARPIIDIDIPRVPDRVPMAPSGAAKIHLLTLVDGDAANIGKTHTAGANLFTQLLRSGIRGERFGQVVRLSGADLAPDAISRAIDDLPVKAEDTLVVYYAGPAEYDELAMGFILAPSKAPAKLPREELTKKLQAKNARLTVLLVDPASNLAVREPANKPEAPNPGPTGLERLFFGFRGIVDMHACSVGEFAAPRGEYGGCFTLAFVREFGRPAGSWADLLEGVKHTTNSTYKSYRLETLRAADQPPPVKAIYRNQESQVPAPLTPLDNLKPVANSAALPGELPEVTLKLDPVNRPEQRTALLHLKVPATAQLWINGQPTTQQGDERMFDTPPLPTDAPQVWEVRMEVDGWAGVYQLNVIGGKATQVELVAGK